MKTLLVSTILQVVIIQVIAPPVNKAPPKAEDVDPFEWTNNMEYKHYLMEVLTELEQDKEFQKRVAKVKDHNSTESIADQLQFASHNVRTRLDEIKRQEIIRLNDLMKKKKTLEREDEKDKGHIDHANPHSFEIKDLRRLINKVASDLVQTDNQQEDEFKRYEMEKELKTRQKLNRIKDAKLRAEEKVKIEESKKRHRKHEKLHHPGSEEQLKDVWEKEDHLDRDSFEPKTFFRMHDKDDNGHLDAAEIEALMMKELEKVYDENNPDDDLMERYHEMMKMRQEIMREVDLNNDTVISYDEFLEWTKKREFKEDSGWKTTEEKDKPVFTDDELQRFTDVYKAEHPDETLEDVQDHEDGKRDPNQLRVKQHEERREDENLLKTKESLGKKADKL